MSEVRSIAALVVVLASCLTGCPGSDMCALECPQPPVNCRYEGGHEDGYCDEVTCGELVCREPIVLDEEDAGSR
ncbi:MAG: hypothetical protein ABW321_17915 [Polyangiales bacterium]